jgi:hypothetical protein
MADEKIVALLGHCVEAIPTQSLDLKLIYPNVRTILADIKAIKTLEQILTDRPRSNDQNFGRRHGTSTETNNGDTTSCFSNRSEAPHLICREIDSSWL